MAVTVTYQKKSVIPLADYCYNVTGLVNGSQTITLPTPPAAGSFPVAGDWTPTVVLCFPYNTGGLGALCTPDLSTIANSSGSVTFTLYAANTTNCFIVVL